MNPVEERIISSDDHLDLSAFPPSVFAERVPATYRDRVPKVVDDAERGKIWVVDGKFVELSGRRNPGQLSKEQLGYRPGIAANRLEDMDRDGVYAQVIYGPVSGFQFLTDLLFQLRQPPNFFLKQLLEGAYPKDQHQQISRRLLLPPCHQREPQYL